MTGALVALAALTCLLLVWDKSTQGSIVFYSAQAAFVGLAALAVTWGGGVLPVSLAVAALLSKAVGLAFALRIVGRRLGGHPDTDPLLHTPASVLVAFGLLVFGNALTSGLGADRGVEGLALGVALVGLWLVASRRGALSQIIGLMVAENGATLMLSVAGELRATTELMLLLEALAAPVALLALALWLRRRSGTTDTASLDSLAELPPAAAEEEAA